MNEIPQVNIKLSDKRKNNYDKSPEVLNPQLVRKPDGFKQNKE